MTTVYIFSTKLFVVGSPLTHSVSEKRGQFFVVKKESDRVSNSEGSEDQINVENGRI
jgi:hypothetical protein